jgi:Spy/CpxP family protein refolding chaperone
MKKMVLGIGLAALMAAASVQVIADDHKGKPMRGGPMAMERISRHLELTPEQETQLLELRHERERDMLVKRQEMRARREAGEEFDREAMRAEMQAHRAQMEQDFQTVLTEEQWAKFQEHRAKRMERRGKDHGERHNEN